MRILVTGGAGYLGSVLVPKLLARGHQVRVLDVGYFGVGHLRACNPQVPVLREDIRKVLADAAWADQLLEDVDCVIHLAAVSNDPSAELQPELTHEVNDRATRVLADAAKRRGARFLFSSSCSVYGEAEAEIDESGAVKPLTVYAVTKVMAEQYLESIADESWRPVILRNGTLYGYSPRMRFDLVINIFSLHSTLYDEIRIFGSGNHWRPFLYVGDCARAFVHFAELPEPQYLCYNIAQDNLRVRDVAEIFQRINPRLRVEQVELADEDRRDYRVTVRRAAEEGFHPRASLRERAEEIVEAIINGTITDPESVFYRNAKWLAELTQIGGKGHTELVGFMETIARMRGTT